MGGGGGHAIASQVLSGGGLNWTVFCGQPTIPGLSYTATLALCLPMIIRKLRGTPNSPIVQESVVSQHLAVYATKLKEMCTSKVYVCTNPPVVQEAVVSQHLAHGFVRLQEGRAEAHNFAAAKCGRVGGVKEKAKTLGGDRCGKGARKPTMSLWR